MTAKYWIKLYHEILHDPKMARMDDRLWRRTIELFLLAGEHWDDGSLPCLEDMAWELRTMPEQLETELTELQKFGIISIVQGNYYVSKFAERQQSMTKSEYMQRKRNDKQRREYYQSVTNGNEKVTQNRIDKNRIEEEGNKQSISTSAIIQTWEGITGFTAFISKSKEDDIETINALFNNHGSKTVEYCKPFYDEWIRRGYRKTNTAWLDWAVTGQIPDVKQKDKNGKFIDETWKKEWKP